MTSENEQSLVRRDNNTLLVVHGSVEEGTAEAGSFGDMVTRVLRELKSLPEIRTKEDLPEDIAYLLNRQGGIIIKISRRRQANKVVSAPHHFGYFAEVYELDNQGLPQHVVTDPERVNKGIFERIDVTDFNNIRSYRSEGEVKTEGVSADMLGLTPTRFDFTIQRLTVEAISTQKLLAETTGEEQRVVGQMFAELDKTDSLADLAEEIKQEIRKEVDRIDKSAQGMSNEIANFHLIISDQGEESPLVAISQKLGLHPEVIPAWKATSNLEPFIKRHLVRYPLIPVNEVFPRRAIAKSQFFPQDPLKEFRDRNGAYPLLVTVDCGNCDVEDRDTDRVWHDLIATMIDLRKKHPVFGYIQLAPKGRAFPSTPRRFHNGHYLFPHEDLDSIKGLLVKIATDFALTKQIRAIVELV